MARRSQGFTLIELMIVVSILAVVASVAIPNLLSSRLAANEAVAIGTLRSFATAQAQFRSSMAVDSDQDGGGEYGTLGEMAGVVPMNARGLGPAGFLDPPMIGAPFGGIDASGRGRKAGYYFLIYLPDAVRQGLPEVAGGGPDPLVDANNCEHLWACYAWPINPSITGNRAFFVDQRGEMVETRMDATIYSEALTPPFNAALAGPDMGDPPAFGVPGNDGNRWVPVQ